MIDRVRDHGVSVGELPARESRLCWPHVTRPAFIGRALRGPLDTPVLIDSLAAYQRRFGGPWRKSALSQAVEQFFAHGGRELYVVRVANGATGAELNLPGPAGMLTLAAADPGSTETLRAAIDYDGIDDDVHFNLAIQRLAPQSGLVIDQEIYSRASVFPASPHFIGDALAGSSLARLERPLPTARPYATMGPEAQSRSPYVLAARRGTDGQDLSDYDFVGSRERRTGIFSLDALDDVDLLYLPPPAPDRDPGPAALLAAEGYCRGRGAMLITDPARHWLCANDAATGVREAGLASASVVTFFPRLTIGDDMLPVGAVVAGLLCRLDEEEGPWGRLGERRYAFTRGARPACDVTDAERRMLARSGVNTVARGRDGRFDLAGNVTRARAEQSAAFYTDLSVRRFCLRLAKTLERASRRALFESDSQAAAADVETLARGLLETLEADGVLEPGMSRVRCKARNGGEDPAADRNLTMLLTLSLPRAGAPVSMTLYHTPAGCKIASTAFAPVESPGARADAA